MRNTPHPTTPSAPPSDNGSAAGRNGHATSTTPALLALAGDAITQRLPRETPYTSADHGATARLEQEAANLERRRIDTLDARSETRAKFEKTARHLPFDAEKQLAYRVCLWLLGATSLLAWVNGAIWVEASLTDSLWRGLVISSVIPLVPFIMKYFILLATGRSRLLVDAILFGIFLFGFGVFVDQFSEHFPKIEGVILPGGDDDWSGLETALAPVSLRWLYYGTLALESLASFVFFSWLLELRTPRVNPEWEEGRQRLVELEAQLQALENAAVLLAGQQAELSQRETAQRTLFEMLARVFPR